MKAASAVAGLAAVLAISPASARALTGGVAGSGGTWGAAEKVPGTVGLNKGGMAAVESMSCASPGDCSAGGYFLDNSRREQASVVSENST
jgi:hypothetical protein